MQNNVLLLVGLPGTGKTLAAKYFSIMAPGIPVISLGKLTQKIIKEKGLIINEKNEKQIREKLRLKFGNAVFAEKILPEIKLNLTDNKHLIVEGLRSGKELEYLKKNLKKEKIILIYLDVEKNIRTKRLLTRRKRPMTVKEIEKREDYEINSLKIEKLKSFADYVIENNRSKEEFYKKLKKLI